MNTVAYIAEFIYSICFGLFVLISYKLCGEKENAEYN